VLSFGSYLCVFLGGTVLFFIFLIDNIHECEIINPLTPNGHYNGRTAPLTSRRCILNIYSTNIRTEYFIHAE
jgi:hypothetical protein